MKTGNIFLGALLIVALAGCDRDGAATTDTDDTMPAAPATTIAPAAMESPVATDPAVAGNDVQAGQAEALALLVAVNEHEIAAAEQARAKNVDGGELEFANLMDTEHSTNLEQTRALMAGAAATDSAEVAAQKAKGQAELARLGALEDDAYEDAYIDAMVAGHDEVLRMLDSKLIPAARDDAVRQHFATTREHVAMHLERARALQED